MKERLKVILDALNQIEVRGEHNLDLLLACMQELAKLMREERDESNPE